MALSSGSKLGSYEIVQPLGAGGMGEVYRARDGRLGRDVALKIIRQDMTGPEHLQRFRREARVLATLCHPNVANVYEFDEIGEAAILVMELVPGDTLATRIAAGRLPLAETLRIASQVAAALETVHQNGIIHRDLKPANIKITPEGVVKVLDFGLAKHAASSSLTEVERPTVSFDTDHGLLMGTAAYMSPEHARGWDVDRRTDVWSFGCVVFEMLTGQRAFSATTKADIIAAVLDREIEWNLLPPSTPPSVVRLLRRCLERDPKRRLRDMGDARLDLEEACLEGPADDRLDSRPLSASTPRGRLAWTLAVAAAGALIGGLLVWTGRAAPPATASATRFVVSVPPTTQLAGLDFPSLAIAPDGSKLAFVVSRGNETQLFLRHMNALESTPVAGTANAVAPFFSPDGRWIAFFAGGQLKKVAVSGGTPVTLCEAPVGLGASWSREDVILFAATTGSAISQVSALGGRPQRVSTLDLGKGEFSHRWPEWLPGGRSILYTVATVGSWNDAQIVAQSLATGERTVVVRGGTSPRYLPSGHLLYAHDGTVMSVPFDPEALEVTGTPTPVFERVMQSSDGAAQFSVSPTGHAAYVDGSLGSEDRRLVSVGRDGVVTPLAAPPGPYQWPRVSPDGQKLLVTMESTTPDLWIHDLRSGSTAQLTFDAGATFPAWTPDGLRTVFTSPRGGSPNLFTTPVAQPAPTERLLASEHMQIPGSWSPDGGTLVFVERHPNTGRDILLLSAGPSRSARPLLASPADESGPRVSPDGRWLAYVTNETGRNEVYVRVFDAADHRYTVSTSGGAEPVWAAGSRELFYRNGDAMMIATFAAGEARAPSTRTLFTGEFAAGSLDSANYDVMPDGQRLVMIQRQSQAAPTMLHVLLNWLDPTRGGSLR